MGGFTPGDAVVRGEWDQATFSAGVTRPSIYPDDGHAGYEISHGRLFMTGILEVAANSGAAQGAAPLFTIPRALMPPAYLGAGAALPTWAISNYQSDTFVVPVLQVYLSDPGSPGLGTLSLSGYQYSNPPYVPSAPMFVLLNVISWTLA